MKRLSDSDRERDDGEPALHVVAPVGRRRLALDDRRQAAGDRLDRRQRVVHLVADDANQPLPGLALLFAQRLAQVGEHQQLVRPAALAERAAPDLPAADAAGKRGVDDARRVAGQAVVEVELLGARRPSSRSAGWLSSRAPARLTNLSSCSSSNVKTATSISAITLRRSVVASSASSRWWRSVSTSALTSIITSPSGSPPRAPRARIEKSPSPSAASRFESVWSGRTTRSRSANAKPRQKVTMRTRQRPLDLGREVAGPEKDERDERPGQRRGERHQQDAPVVAQARLAGAVDGMQGSGVARVQGSGLDHLNVEPGTLHD